MAQYLKTKTWNLRKILKVSFTVPVMDSGYSAQLDHLMLFFIYNRDYFSKLLFSFELFLNKKLGIGTSFSPVKIDPDPS